LDGSRPHVLLIGGDGGRSGVPTHLAQLMRALGPEARFTVLSDRNTGGYDFVAAEGGRHVELPGLRTSLAPWRLARALRGTARAIDTAQPDLVWAHARMAVLVVRLLAVWRRLAGGRALPPLAITLHGLPFGPGHRPLSGLIARALEAAFLRLMPPHHLVVLSAEAAHAYAAGIGCRAEERPDGGFRLGRHRLHVQGNCSDLGALPHRPVAGPPVVVMTGRAGYQKDHVTAARIVAHLPADWRLVICGAGTDRPAFRRRILRAAGQGGGAGQGRGGADRIRFLGPVRDVRPLLQGADLFLMTSRYEGMPIAALEAFEAGLPLASTTIPGMAGILAAHPLATALDRGDPQAAARAIRALVDTWRRDPEGHAARIRAAWAGRFSFPAWQREMRQLVQRLRAPP
jgi:glycosyltransferase involved in cell wall biosynthesis